MEIIPKGHEPFNIKQRMDTLFSKLDEAYPDKIIKRLEKEHKKWAETAREISKQLGYENKNVFLESYGYTIEIGKGGGREKTVDAKAIISELQKRYPNGTKFAKIDELFDANPDLAKKKNDPKHFQRCVRRFFKGLLIVGRSFEQKSRFSRASICARSIVRFRSYAIFNYTGTFC